MTFMLWIGLVTGRILWLMLTFFLFCFYVWLRRKAFENKWLSWIKLTCIGSLVAWGLFCLALNPYRDWRKAEMIASLLKEAHPADSHLMAYLSGCTDDGRMEITQWREFSGDKAALLQFYQRRQRAIEVVSIHKVGAAVVLVRIPDGPLWRRFLPWSLSYLLPPSPAPRLVRATDEILDIHYDIHIIETDSPIWDLRCGDG